MRNSRLIVPAAGTTPMELRSAPGHRHEISDDLLREASQRLGIMSLLGAVLWTVGTAAGHLSYHAMHPAAEWLRLDSTDGIAAASIAISLALYFYTRHTRRDPRRVLDLGLVYLVVMGLALGLMIHTGVEPGDTPSANALLIRPEISWIGVVVLITAAIVPSTPGKMAIAGLIAVSMNPVAMLHIRSQGHWDFLRWTDVLLMHYPDYILVGVGVLISRVVATLGHQVSKARELGSYHLGELLGRGGMGEVYRATHRMLARPAAIKLIRPEALVSTGDGEGAQMAIRRFRREAEAAANLRSPHTVEVYDFGVREDETLYYVMELLDGMDLETLVRQSGPLPASRAIYLLRQVCESLAEAHAEGLVHRDIKPANIHVGRVALRHDFVKVLDFGLVKSSHARPGGAAAAREYSLATAAGLTPGTPAYMAPEMALGETVDGRTDLYALGCVAYYVLTGHLVFEAETPFQVIARHLQNDPEPPSQRTTNPVPPELDALVLRCLAKSPADRPQTATELDDALGALAIAPWGEADARAWWASSKTEPLYLPDDVS
ncbi:MAG TPA: serine/threonine-protein kinase, partial [Gemmatimonadaceae bacterium]|nr:serine/threonine-protein kinase [Gemmatimonadaceae bacterium]